MLKKTLQITIGLFILSNASFAQWGGSNTTTGDTYRDGNVGIGTNAPAAKLDINMYNPTSTSAQYGLLLKTNTFFTWANAENSYFLKTSDPGNTNATFIINGKGYVGIGNPNPQSSLDVTGDVHTTGSIGIGTAAPASKVHIDIFNANSTTPQLGVLLKTGTFHTGDNAANSYYLKAMDGDQTTSFILKGNGNVGIGTENTGIFKLAVEGKIGAREIQVTLTNPFPDYVFDSKYKLRSLYNLENYISQSKHLPGIPSAAEVEKNGGIELGAMNTKLLEKIEELTLYVIEINKKVEKLEKENEALKKGN